VSYQANLIGSFWGSPIVVSGLAPRWGAKRAQPRRRVLSDKPDWHVLGPLRSPAQGKPAHYNSLNHHNNPNHNNKPGSPPQQPRSPQGEHAGHAFVYAG